MSRGDWNIKVGSTGKVWQLTSAGDCVASTGDSPLAKVLEQMKVYGNENAQTPFRAYWAGVCERYGEATSAKRDASRRQTQPPKAKRAVLDANTLG